MNSNRTYTKAVIKQRNKQVTYEVVQIGKNQYIRNNNEKNQMMNNLKNTLDTRAIIRRESSQGRRDTRINIAVRNILLEPIKLPTRRIVSSWL